MFLIKASSFSTYNIAEQDFSYFFPDDPPTFIFSPANRRRGRPPKRISFGQVGKEKFKLPLAVNKTVFAISEMFTCKNNTLLPHIRKRECVLA